MSFLGGTGRPARTNLKQKTGGTQEGSTNVSRTGPHMVYKPRLYFLRIMLTPADIQTLARMTGKNFSGPVPVIKAPTPLKMVEDDHPPQQRQDITPVLKKKSHTPGLQPASEGEEVLGDVDDYEDND